MVSCPNDIKGLAACTPTSPHLTFLFCVCGLEFGFVGTAKSPGKKSEPFDESPPVDNALLPELP